MSMQLSDLFHHRHQLKVASVQHGVNGEGYAATCALLMCRCGFFQTELGVRV